MGTIEGEILDRSGKNELYYIVLTFAVTCFGRQGSLPME